MQAGLARAGSVLAGSARAGSVLAGSACMGLEHAGSARPKHLANLLRYSRYLLLNSCFLDMIMTGYITAYSSGNVNSANPTWEEFIWLSDLTITTVYSLYIERSKGAALHCNSRRWNPSKRNNQQTSTITILPDGATLFKERKLNLPVYLSPHNIHHCDPHRPYSDVKQPRARQRWRRWRCRREREMKLRRRWHSRVEQC
jgi:hypothetical protein